MVKTQDLGPRVSIPDLDHPICAARGEASPVLAKRNAIDEVRVLAQAEEFFSRGGVADPDQMAIREGEPAAWLGRGRAESQRRSWQ